MNKIKFCHLYYKMPAAYKESLLVEVIVLNEAEISDEFREYDTAYPIFYAPDGHYPLPKGKLILLLLIANSGQGWLWCTMRRWTLEKEKYYRSIRDQKVEIIIEEIK